MRANEILAGCEWPGPELWCAERLFLHMAGQDSGRKGAEGMTQQTGAEAGKETQNVPAEAE